MLVRRVKICCPCCGHRLFDLDTDGTAGNETINVKCSRCKGIAAIKLKNYVQSK